MARLVVGCGDPNLRRAANASMIGPAASGF
jgi:hypothetical protein